MEIRKGCEIPVHTNQKLQLFNIILLEYVLAELGVDGQNLRVAHKSEGQYRDGVCGLQNINMTLMS